MTKSEQIQSERITKLLKEAFGEDLTEDEREEMERARKNKEMRKKLAMDAL